MKKLLKNNAGFSLLEVTIAAGLLAVVALGFMKFQQTQMKSTKSVINQAEVNNFYQAFKAYLGKPGICKSSLQDYGNLSDGLEIESIKRPDGKVKYKIGQKIAGTNFALVSIKVADLYLDKKDGAQEYRGEASVILEMQMYNNNAYGGKKHTKKIELDIIVEPNGSLVDCGVLGGLYLPLSSIEKVEGSDIGLGDSSDLDKAFEENIKKASQKTGQDIDQSDIKKAIENSPELKEAMKSLKLIQEQTKAMEQEFSQ